MSDIYLSLTETPSVVTLSQPVIGSSVAATVTVGNTVTVALDANSLSALENVTVTVGAAVSVSNFPSTQTVAGTVTANLVGWDGGNLENVRIGGYSVGEGNAGRLALEVIGVDGNPLSISGTVTANVGFSSNVGEAIPEQAVLIAYNTNNFMEAVGENTPLPISGTVTVGNTVAISGTVTANPTGTQTIAGTVTVSGISTSVTARLVDISGTAVSYASTGTAGTPSSDVISVQGVSGGTSLPISGTAGTLTTRFGSVTTANTAQISSAVTNTSRKYLLIQNVTTSSNVITIGIGFTPTTTQGIQLTAGAGITFESSYIPTGAVYVLSSVTASPFTILEA